jgi:biopolymer transport protein ExbD
MVNLKSVKVNLPSAAAASSDSARNLTDITVDKNGSIYLNKKPVAGNELIRALIAARQADPNLRVLISGDRDGRYGDDVRVLDLVNSAGIDKVALDVRPVAAGTQP